jgi:isoleucyl-tRNA synthetase
MSLQQIEEKHSIIKVEEQILDKWTNENTFQTCLEKTKQNNCPLYSFYDGPPFATGSPHYGHILAGTIKDVIGRRKTMEGFHVNRRAGWDCHGVPIEMIIQKKLGISSKKDIEKYTIAKFNRDCRKVVMTCADEWKEKMGRLGRWVDFDNDYKTLDNNFMESVWWVFSELFKKGLVYRGFKVMPYSCAMSTCLSNFEAGQNYKECTDPSIVVHFPLVNDQSVNLLAWTTTPWTLPSNIALCTSKNMDLVQVYLFDKEINKLDETKSFIASEKFFKSKKKKYKVIRKLKGSELKNEKYVPVFPFFVGKVSVNAFQVLVDDYVKDDTGTGIVHQAPAFGEDDNRVCRENKLIDKECKGMPCPVDDDGCFSFNDKKMYDMKDINGKLVKDCDKIIIKQIKENNRLFDCKWEKHNYPFCWRTDKPLIYKAVPSWYINVEQIKEKLIENNKKSKWVPSFVQEKRFHNWLEGAKDWSVSRSRYWGTPLPIWTNEDFSEVVVIGSIQELEEKSGQKITDLHRDYIDHITIPSEKGNGVLKRIPEIFDCWFESGSMPYGQMHYPFENKEEFEKLFPADFISEGLDQTRGWFYTLMVLSTALFDKPAFKNVIVNGLLLATSKLDNGQKITEKMSKSKNNYTDPMEIVNKYGADALRMYLLGSPAVKANSVAFEDDGVHNIVKEILLPFTNSYKFFVECYTMFKNNNPDDTIDFENYECKEFNEFDKWILSFTKSLIGEINKDIENYQLDNVIKKIKDFIEKLNNVYIRLNRDRMKGKTDNAKLPLYTLFNVLYNFVQLIAPFAPFHAEFFYNNLKVLVPNNEQSVHFCLVPTMDEFKTDKLLEYKIQKLSEVINMVRNVRNKHTIQQKAPLKKIIVCHQDEKTRNYLNELENYIMEESNVLTVQLENQDKYVDFEIKPIMKSVGKKYKKDVKKIINLLDTVSVDQIMQFKANGELKLDNYVLLTEDLEIVPKIVTIKGYENIVENDLLILVDTTIDQETTELCDIRIFGSVIQQMRKKAGLHSWDKIKILYDSDEKFVKVINKHMNTLKKRVLYDVLPISHKSNNYLIEEKLSINDSNIQIRLEKL